MGSAIAASPCSFGVEVAVGSFVSSGLLACEAPPAPPLEHSSSATSSSTSSSSPSFIAAARAVPLRVATAGAAGAAAASVAYTYLPEADVSTLEPSTGPVYGGTRLRIRLNGGGDGGGGAVACRFGPIVVSASTFGVGAGEGEDGVQCLAPAGRPGWTDVGVVGARGAACDSTGAGFVNGGPGAARSKYRYHSLD